MGKKRQPPKPPKYDLMQVVREAQARGIENVIVATSCGKDSVAALDLCREHFQRVQPFFMYFVRGLSFQEKYLCYLERRFDVEILRIPHWGLAAAMRNMMFRHPTRQTRKLRNVRIRDVHAYLRKKFGLHWIATGEKVCDSLERRAQIVAAGGINEQRGVFWPVAFFTHNQVFAHLASRQIALPPDYRVNFQRRSLSGLWAREVLAIKENFPDDFQKIVRMFPLIESQIQRQIQLESQHAQEEDN